jgi:hypothetical protein
MSAEWDALGTDHGRRSELLADGIAIEVAHGVDALAARRRRRGQLPIVWGAEREGLRAAGHGPAGGAAMTA